MNHLVAIVGPTGVGKSRLALKLAQIFNGEIVSADSRQVYRHMDIGTAKPSRKELSLIPHHLIDTVNLDEAFSLAQYQELAYRAIDDIHKRQKLPIFVGGSGLYVWSVVEGWEVPRVPPDLDFRCRLEAKAANGDGDELYRQLMNVDPVAAEKIDKRNVRRVIRALEIYKGTKSTARQPQFRKAPPYNTLLMGLTTDRAELYQKIDSRVNRMIAQGLVKEVRRLIDMGYSLDLPAISGIGYRQIAMFQKGELSLAEAIEQIKFESHRFVRHQYNWFRLKDSRIRWFDITDEAGSEIAALVDRFILRNESES
ncbi:MAG: tRNA (adenosine(37)-N6)-dimethylallyltransferase MiaA [Dehalococcoidales bacterium]|jgi:tRNA dimethylallyltransferase|nr:tRNA (adenosine(37)-N6)-dimethylallyltransferase MiaA [Dehalococcoidales bacterium]